MLQKQGRPFLWCWRWGALGVWHLTWTVLTERSHTQRPSPPLPTIQLPTTTYNPHNPLTTTQHYTTPILHTNPTVQPIPLQRETSFLEDESLLSNALSTSHIHRSVSTKLLFVLSLSWQYASSGFIPLLSKNFDHLHKVFLSPSFYISCFSS